MMTVVSLIFTLIANCYLNLCGKTGGGGGGGGGGLLLSVPV